MSELKDLLSPSSLSVLLVLAALLAVMMRFEALRKAMVRSVADEANRQANPAPQPISVKQPFVVAPEDPPMTRSACTFHMQAMQSQIAELARRLDRREQSWDADVKRIHDRIDEIPARVIALLSDTKGIHDRD